MWIYLLSCLLSSSERGGIWTHDGVKHRRIKSPVLLPGWATRPCVDFINGRDRIRTCGGLSTPAAQQTVAFPDSATLPLYPEAVGFEPTVSFNTPVFKTGAITQTRPRLYESAIRESNPFGLQYMFSLLITLVKCNLSGCDTIRTRSLSLESRNATRNTYGAHYIYLLANITCS